MKNVLKSQDELPIDRDDLIERISSKLAHLFKRYSISFAILAGSWARGQQSWWSDVDIFVSCPKYADKSVEDRLQILIDLNVTAETVTKLSNIEIRILEKQATHVQYELLKDGIVIYQKVEYERNHLSRRNWL